MEAAAITACFPVKNADSKRFFLQVIECLRNFERRRVRILSENRGIDFLTQCVDRLTSSNLTERIVSSLDAIPGHLVGNFEQVVSTPRKSTPRFRFPTPAGGFFFT